MILNIYMNMNNVKELLSDIVTMNMRLFLIKKNLSHFQADIALELFLKRFHLTQIKTEVLEITHKPDNTYMR